MRSRCERVVDVAIALLDADGLDALTMRKLATRLGVQAGALYWHFASKQALLDAMADRFLEVAPPICLPVVGRAALGSWAGGYATCSCPTAMAPGSWPAPTLPSRTPSCSATWPSRSSRPRGCHPTGLVGRLCRVPLRARPHHRRTSADRTDRARRLGTEADCGQDREQARRHGLHRRSRRAVRLRPPAHPRRHPPATDAAPLRRPGSFRKSSCASGIQ